MAVAVEAISDIVRAAGLVQSHGGGVLDRGIAIGAAMVRDGLALAFGRYSADYIVQEREAQQAGRGMWAGTFATPWEWRLVRRAR